MTKVAFLGLDIGGTACRWSLCDATGERIANGEGPGATGHVFNPSELARLRVAFQAVADGVSPHGHDIAGVTAGITGFGAPVAAQIQALAAETLGVDAGTVLVIDDIALAYAANFQPGDGHLISAGTGSIGIHIDAEGNYTRVGGRGILVDDAGSGSWISLRAIDAMYRSLDRTGSFADVPHLARAVFGVTGGDDWHAVRQYIYGGDRGRIGALAVAVAEAARAGDATSLSILRRAGAELAQLALALAARCGTRPVALVGRVSLLHPVISEAIAETLGDIPFSFPSNDAALAAARAQAEGNAPWLSVLRKLATL